MSSRSGSFQPAEVRAGDLRVCLLGPPEMECAGHPLPIPRRQARALLFRLAARYQPAPREHIYRLFWSDILESPARRNFSRLLTTAVLFLP